MSDPAKNPAPPPGPSNLDELLADHAKKIEAPNPDAVAQELKRAGEALDPEVFQIGQDGKPRMHKTEGRPKLKTGPKGKTPEVLHAAAVEEEKKKLQFTALGVATADTIFLMMTMIGGEEWRPSNDEREGVRAAWGSYYEARGIPEMPPEVMLAGAMLTWAAPRLMNPQTRQKLFQKFKGGRNGQTQAQEVRHLEEQEDRAFRE